MSDSFFYHCGLLTATAATLGLLAIVCMWAIDKVLRATKTWAAVATYLIHREEFDKWRKSNKT